MLRVSTLLLLSAVATSGRALATGNDLFIGQFRVEDARPASPDRHTLQYRIVHDEPELLQAQLARWGTAPSRNRNGVSFSLSEYPATPSPAADSSHLASTFLIDYRQPSIQALRKPIEQRYGARPSPDELEQFVYEHIADKNFEHGFDVASVVAQAQSGDCSEHAVLLTALLRLYDYPARTVVGVYVSLQDPVLAYGHAWTEYYGTAGWTGIDGTRIGNTVGAQYIPLGVIGDESIAYRMAVVSNLRYLSIRTITVK